MIFLPDSLQEWAAEKQFTALHIEMLRLFLAHNINPAGKVDFDVVEVVADNAYKKTEELLATLREHGHEIREDEYAAWVSARADIAAKPGVVQEVLANATGTEPDLVQNVTALAGITGRTVISHQQCNVAPIMQAAIDTLIAEGVAVATLRVHDVIKAKLQAEFVTVDCDPIPA